MVNRLLRLAPDPLRVGWRVEAREVVGMDTQSLEPCSLKCVPRDAHIRNGRFGLSLNYAPSRRAHLMRTVDRPSSKVVVEPERIRQLFFRVTCEPQLQRLVIRNRHSPPSTKTLT